MVLSPMISGQQRALPEPEPPGRAWRSRVPRRLPGDPARRSGVRRSRSGAGSLPPPEGKRLNGPGGTSARPRRFPAPGPAAAAPTPVPAGARRRPVRAERR